jgi:hypothetical protein
MNAAAQRTPAIAPSAAAFRAVMAGGCGRVHA